MIALSQDSLARDEQPSLGLASGALYADHALVPTLTPASYDSDSGALRCYAAARLRAGHAICEERGNATECNSTAAGWHVG